MSVTGVKRVPDEEIVAAIVTHPDPFVTTSEVTECVDLTHRSVFGRLEELARTGRIEKKEVGARANIYWVESELPDMESIKKSLPESETQ